jgi:hypothetical protein
MPVVVLTAGSTGWRFVRYYRRDRACVRRGAPPAYRRILGSVLIAGTVILAASGMPAFAGPNRAHADEPGG